MTPAVSVLMPCYEQAQCLSDAIESLRAQAFLDWEAIVVACDEQSARVAHSVSARDARVRAIEQDPFGPDGPSASRNIAAAAARAPLLMCLDADDTLDPSALELLTAAAARLGPYAIAYGDVLVWGAREASWRPDYAPGALRQRNCLPYAALHTRGIWEKTGGWDEALLHCEDWAYWIAASRLGPEVTHIGRPLLRYRSWEGNRSSHLDPSMPLWAAMVHMLLPDVFAPSRDDRIAVANLGKAWLGPLRHRLARFPEHALLREWVGLVEGTVAP